MSCMYMGLSAHGSSVTCRLVLMELVIEVCCLNVSSLPNFLYAWTAVTDRERSGGTCICILVPLGLSALNTHCSEPCRAHEIHVFCVRLWVCEMLSTREWKRHSCYFTRTFAVVIYRDEVFQRGCKGRVYTTDEQLQRHLLEAVSRNSQRCWCVVFMDPKLSRGMQHKLSKGVLRTAELTFINNGDSEVCVSDVALTGKRELVSLLRFYFPKWKICFNGSYLLNVFRTMFRIFVN